MKTFLILVLTVACLILFYSVKIKSKQLDEQEATIADLTSQLEAARLKAAEQGGVRVAPVPPPAPALPAQPAALPQAVVAAPVAAGPGPNTDKALGEFATTMNAEIATSPPPFMIFMDEAEVALDAKATAAGEEGFPQLAMDRRVAVDRYNGFMTHLFPGRPDLRMVAPAPGAPENASSSQVKLSPAKMLWVAVDDSSPDAKYALRWMKTNSPQLGVTEGAMQTLDQQIAGNASPNSPDAKSAALARGLHDAQNALKRLLNGKPPVAEDQRQVAFFLREAGVGK